MNSYAQRNYQDILRYLKVFNNITTDIKTLSSNLNKLRNSHNPSNYGALYCLETESSLISTFATSVSRSYLKCRESLEQLKTIVRYTQETLNCSQKTLFKLSETSPIVGNIELDFLIYENCKLCFNVLMLDFQDKGDLIEEFNNTTSLPNLIDLVSSLEKVFSSSTVVESYVGYFKSFASVL
ncbi:hypothetical protein RCL1_001672 [Eukaryota sp. TZLM3-RCL]